MLSGLVTRRRCPITSRLSLPPRTGRWDGFIVSVSVRGAGGGRRRRMGGGREGGSCAIVESRCWNVFHFEPYYQGLFSKHRGISQRCRQRPCAAVLSHARRLSSSRRADGPPAPRRARGRHPGRPACSGHGWSAISCSIPVASLLSPASPLLDQHPLVVQADSRGPTPTPNPHPRAFPLHRSHPASFCATLPPYPAILPHNPTPLSCP